MKSVVLLYATWCHNCPAAKKFWKNLSEEYGFNYREVDVESEEGKKFVEELDIMGVPTTIIDNEVEFVGIPDKNEAIAKIT
jgi:glutaredoxin